MRTYVSPLGYDSTRVTRPVLSEGLDSGDALVLIRPDTDVDGEAGDEDVRAREAVADVRRMLGEIEPDVDVSVEEVPYDDLPEATLRCSDLLRAAEGT